MQFNKLVTPALVIVIICFAVAFGPSAFSLVSSKLANNAMEVDLVTDIPTTQRSRSAIARVEGALVVALAEHSSNQWHSFWNNLKTGYELFETNKKPPNTTVIDGRYVFDY